jgi:hypothetical protein
VSRPGVATRLTTDRGIAPPGTLDQVTAARLATLDPALAALPAAVAALDAGLDTGLDAGLDAGLDTGLDTGLDAGLGGRPSDLPGAAIPRQRAASRGRPAVPGTTPCGRRR